jgi:PAS domain S-box-containing protein
LGASSSTLSGAESFSVVEELKDYAVFMLDSEGHVVTWNEGARLIKGYTAGEIIGRSFACFYTPEDLARGKPSKLLEKAKIEGRVEDEGWRVRKDGTRFWADVVITALHDSSGNVRGFLKVTRDLTDRRGAQELLHQSEERFRLLVESVKDYAIFMLGVDGKITTWNSGAEHITGYRAEEAIEKHFSIFYPAEGIDEGRPELELEIAASVGRYEEEGWRVRKDGQRYWASVVLTAIHDPVTNNLRGFAKVTRDLTERRRMELEARAAEEQAATERARLVEAQNALRLRDEFVSVAAHELRTPLSALQLKLDGISLSR